METEMIRNLTCPECKKEFSLSEALQHKANHSVKQMLDARLAAQVESLRTKLAEVKARESGLVEREQQIHREALKEAEALTQKKVEAAESRAREVASKERELLAEQLGDLKSRLKSAEEDAIAVRKEKTQLAQEKASWELEQVKRLDAEREKIRSEAQQAASDEFKQKVELRDLTIERLKKDADELRRRAEQGSQQSQGEVLQTNLEDMLRQTFPVDNFQPVPRGTRGADTHQIIINNAGEPAGSVLWEYKNTKNWDPGWVGKLKEDQRSVGADVAVLVTAALPKEVKNFGHHDGIWVSSVNSAQSLGMALRLHIAEKHATLALVQGKTRKQEVLFDYVTSTPFKHRITASVEYLVAVRTDLAKFRQTSNKFIDKQQARFTQIEVQILGMYADLQGRMGNALPDLELLGDDDDVEQLLPGDDDAS